MHTGWLWLLSREFEPDPGHQKVYQLSGGHAMGLNSQTGTHRAVADPGIDGRGAREGGLWAVPPAGVQGEEPPLWGLGSKAPDADAEA